MDFAALTASTQSAEDLAAALALNFSDLSDEALNEHFTERRDEATRLFAIEEPSVNEAIFAEALVASINEIEAEQGRRDAEVADAAARFAAARASFSAEPVGENEPGAEETGAEETGTETGTEGEGESPADAGDGTDAGGDTAVTTAAAVARGRRRIPAAPTQTSKRVAAAVARPNVAETPPVIITAASNVPGHSAGATLDGMVAVAAATQEVARTFSPYSASRAEALRSSGQFEAIQKVPVAQFSVTSTNDLTSKSGVEEQYSAVADAVKAHVERVNASLGYDGPEAMAAAMAWCSPSEVVYNWIADFVVDGLWDAPEISAPRGGLMLTEGPQLLQNALGGDVTDYGFGGTEAEMEAGYVKTCETIVCPDFVDHRLDFDGYCWKIPILTESSFPELIADAMRSSDVAYAHKINQRKIKDVIDMSVARPALDARGATTLDTLEVLAQIATKERRWWNLGRNAVIEVKLPDYALDIFKIDMQRRSGLALSDVATEAKINAYFANHRLSVKYLSDFDERATSTHPTADWPANIRAIMYPAGTFVVAQKDVIQLSAVHDAASMSANEYTGVFYEQGLKVIRRGYRSTVVTVPVCTAGVTGANILACEGSV
jgi:hypothetical protein